MPVKALLTAALLSISIAPALGQTHDFTPRELHSIMGERERANGQRFDAQEKAVSAALAAAKEAVAKAEAAAEKRFDSVNEFRNTLKDQQLTLAPRAEMEIRFHALDEKLRALELRQAQIISKADGATWLWGVIVAVAGLLFGISTIYFAFKKSSPAAKPR